MSTAIMKIWLCPLEQTGTLDYYVRWGKLVLLQKNWAHKQIKSNTEEENFAAEALESNKHQHSQFL